LIKKVNFIQAHQMPVLITICANIYPETFISFSSSLR